MSNIIDNVIEAELGTVEIPTETTSQENISEPAVQTEEVVETQVEEIQIETPEEKEPYSNTNWPPKAENAHSKLKRRATKLTDENESLKNQIAELKSQLESNVEPKEPPQEGDYNLYDDYMNAQVDYRVEAGIQEAQKTQNEKQLASLEAKQQEVYKEQRSHHMAEKLVEMTKVYEDYNQVLNPYMHTINAMPSHVENVALAIDNAPLAFYNLAKEGKIEQLAYMPPEIATAEIIQAQYRNVKQPENVMPQKTVSSAPKPMKAVKGTAVPKTAPMTKDEFFKQWGLK